MTVCNTIRDVKFVSFFKLELSFVKFEFYSNFVYAYGGVSLFWLWLYAYRILLHRGRIACSADHCNTYNNSVCLSVTRWYPIQTNEGRIVRSSLWGSKNTIIFWYQQYSGGRRPLPPKICAQSDPLYDGPVHFNAYLALYTRTMRCEQMKLITTMLMQCQLTTTIDELTAIMTLKFEGF